MLNIQAERIVWTERVTALYFRHMQIFDAGALLYPEETYHGVFWMGGVLSASCDKILA